MAQQIEQDHLPYITRILSERLATEKANLAFFEDALKSSDPLVVRQANGNISSNKSRIEQLLQAQEHLKTYKKK